MTDKKPMVFACHEDDERSQQAHPFWYRFESSPGVLWFTFPTVADVPEACHCGNKFHVPAEQAALGQA